MRQKEECHRGVRMTKQRLYGALIALLQEKPVREVTVQELTGRARVSRGTFYFHYADIRELMMEMEEEQQRQLEQMLDTLLPRLNEDTAPQALCSLFEYLAENDKLCSALLGPNGDPGFLRRLERTLGGRCLEHLIAGGQDTPAHRYATAFAVRGCLGCVAAWLRRGRPEPPDQIADLTWQAIRAVNEVAKQSDSLLAENR